MTSAVENLREKEFALLLSRITKTRKFVPLFRVLYWFVRPQKKVFSSSKFHHGETVAEVDGSYYALYHNKIYRTDAQGTINYDEEHHPTNVKPLDFSITKSVVMILITGLLMFLLFKYLFHPFFWPDRLTPILFWGGQAFPFLLSYCLFVAFLLLLMLSPFLCIILTCLCAFNLAL